MKVWQKTVVAFFVSVLIIGMVTFGILKNNEKQNVLTQETNIGNDYVYEDNELDNDTDQTLYEHESESKNVSGEDEVDGEIVDTSESSGVGTKVRLEFAEMRIKEKYPDSFSMQETLYNAEEESYYELKSLWDGLSESEKMELKGVNERLLETYFDSPATHLTLLKEEIEAYRNMNN